MSIIDRAIPLVLVSVLLANVSIRAEEKTPFVLLRSIDAKDGKCRWVEFTPDGNAVATCGDRLVQAFDIGTGELIRQFRGNQLEVERFSFSPNGKYVASAGGDSTIHVWRVKTGDLVTVIRGHIDKIIGVRFSEDSKWLASTARQPIDSTIRIWECGTWKEVAQVGPPRERTNSMYVAFSPNSKQLAASGYQGTIRLFGFDGKSLTLQESRRHDRGEMVPHVVFSPEGRFFVTSGWDKTLRAWDSKTGRELWQARAPEHARCFEAAVFAPDGSTIYCVTRDETIQARESRTGKLIASFRHQGRDQIRGLAISTDGNQLATAGHRGRINLWRINARSSDK